MKLTGGAPRAAEAAAMIALSVTIAMAPHQTALAVSGGGKDFSAANLAGESFDGQKLAHKEFRGAFCKGASFLKANLAGASFFKADLTNAALSGADLTGASLEEAGLEGALLDDAVLASSYLTRTISDSANIKGADFSEAVMPLYTQKSLCARDDATGVNSKTGVETRESLLCE